MKETYNVDTKDPIIPALPWKPCHEPFVRSSSRVPLVTLSRNDLRQHRYLTLAVLDLVMENLSVDHWRFHEDDSFEGDPRRFRKTFRRIHAER